MSRRKKKRGLPLGIALAVLVIGLVYAGVRGLLPEALTQVLQDSTASQEPSDSSQEPSSSSSSSSGGVTGPYYSGEPSSG